MPASAGKAARPGGGQRPGGAVQGRRPRPGSRPGTGRCTRRPGARRTWTRRCPARSAAPAAKSAGESAMTTPLKLPVRPAGQRRQGHRLRTGRARGVDLGVSAPPGWPAPAAQAAVVGSEAPPPTPPISRTLKSSVGAVVAAEAAPAVATRALTVSAAARNAAKRTLVLRIRPLIGPHPILKRAFLYLGKPQVVR